MIASDAAQSTLNGTPWTYALELHSCALDHDKYEQCKQAVVPVFVDNATQKTRKTKKGAVAALRR